MYRVNSISKQLVRFDVIEGGQPHLVDLLPNNFVFTEECTAQMKQLERCGLIRVRETKVKKVNNPTVPQERIIKEQPTFEGKLDFDEEPEASKVVKVQRKGKK